MKDGVHNGVTKNDQFVKLFIYELYSGKFHFYFSDIFTSWNFSGYTHDVKLCKRLLYPWRQIM